MIPNFDEYIYEGLWSKGIERSHTGEIRIGDLNEIDNYIRNVKWVDLGHPKYLFSQKDLPSSPKKLDDLLSSNEIGELIKKLPTGVSIMDLSLLNWIKNNCKVYSFSNGLKYENIEKNDYSYLNANVYYFLKGTHRSLSTDNHADVYINHLSYNPIGKYRPTIKNEFNEEENNKKCYCVKLIKQKSMNEGLWSKGIDRSKKGYERLGDKLVTNIDQLNWIDLGFDFLISDVDFEIDGSKKITYTELENAFLHIKSKGCRVPGWNELKSSLLKFQGTPPELYDWLKVYTKSEQRGTHVYLESDKTHKKVEFYIDNPYGQSYWCRYDKRDLEKNTALIKNARIMRINDPKYAYEGMLFSFENEDKKEKLKVRLVKDKHVNEGLWSKGVDRSKSGEERLEDKSPIYMVCEKMSKFLSEHYKIPDEDLCSVLDMKKEEKLITFIIGVHVKNTNFTLNCQVPIVYKDDETKTADCLYDSIVGEHLFGDQKDPGGKGRIIRIMIKGIKELYGF